MKFHLLLRNILICIVGLQSEDDMVMRQLIIARKDLQMSPGKLAAQCCHASIAFIVNLISNNTEQRRLHWYPAVSASGVAQRYKRNDLDTWAQEARDKGQNYFYAKPVNPAFPYGEFSLCEPEYEYESNFVINNDIYEHWINGTFTKTICEAKNKNQLMKAIHLAEELGLIEGEDFFLIKDACLTELEPEEVDENGVGRVLTCIGFRPLPDEIIHQISKKYQLYK